MNTSRPAFTRRAFVASGALTALTAGCGTRTLTGAPTAATAPVIPPRPSNVQVSHDSFTGHIEPCLAVNPRNTANLVAVSRAFTSTKLGLASYASFDGGATWRSNGLLPSLVPQLDGNPTVTFDAHGRCFACGLVGPNTQLQQGNVLVWRSGDGGRTFGAPVTAVTGFLDHPWLSADPAPGSTPGFLYLAGTFYNSTRNGLAFTRSADGGRSFETPQFPDPVNGSRGILPVTAAGPGGAIHIMYAVPAPDGRSGLTKVLTSTDHGASFAVPASLPLSIVPPPAPGKVITRCGPTLAAAPDGSGVYAAVATYDITQARSRLQLSFSRDQGRTWSAPVTLASSSQTIYFEPQTAAAVGGRVAITAFALTDGGVAVLLFTANPHNRNYRPPVTITTQPFDPTHGTSANGGTAYWLGNYQGLAATPRTIHPIWNDTRTGSTQIFTASLHG